MPTVSVPLGLLDKRHQLLGELTRLMTLIEEKTEELVASATKLEADVNAGREVINKALAHAEKNVTTWFEAVMKAANISEADETALENISDNIDCFDAVDGDDVASYLDSARDEIRNMTESVLTNLPDLITAMKEMPDEIDVPEEAVDTQD